MSAPRAQSVRATRASATKRLEASGGQRSAASASTARRPASTPHVPRLKCKCCAAAEQEHVRALTLPGSAKKPPLFVSFAGGGIYFFWQLGAAKYLRDHFDLLQVPMAGASSGALVACLAACNVRPDLILETAYELSLDNDIWNRKFGLLGIWGQLIRDWLDALLPADAHELVSGRLHVVIAKAPTLDLFEVNHFDNKGDLIEATMASAHVPFFLDGRPFLKYREQLCWDGSFPDFVNFDNSEFLKRGDKTLIVDYSMDAELNWTRGDFLKLRPYEEILELIDIGYKYMEREHARGLIDSRWETAPYCLAARAAAAGPAAGTVPGAGAGSSGNCPSNGCSS